MGGRQNSGGFGGPNNGGMGGIPGSGAGFTNSRGPMVDPGAGFGGSGVQQIMPG